MENQENPNNTTNNTLQLYNTTTVQYSKEFDTILYELTDLIQSPKYHQWYFSKYHDLGRDRFMELAELARKGNAPEKLFSWMLKHERRVYT